MLAYNITRLVFTVVFIILFAGWLLWNWSFTYWLGAFLLFLAIVGYGSYQIKLNFFTQGLHEGKDSEPKIALTFDDGPSAQHTEEVLDVLKKFGAKATFFCIGKKILENREILRRIHEEGHIVGNHSFSHSYFFDFFSQKKVAEELQATNQLIFEIIGKTSRIFRPPYGVTNPPIARAVKKLGLRVIGWSIRSYDTVNQPVEVVLKNVLTRLKNGSVILLHDDRKNTPKILEGILQHASERNLKCVDICELFDVERYEV